MNNDHQHHHDATREDSQHFWVLADRIFALGLVLGLIMGTAFAALALASP